MYELPEIEVVRRDLEREVVGKKTKSVEVASMKLIGRYKNRKSFTAELDGVKINDVGRRGRWISFGLDNETSMLANLGASASLRRTTNKAKAIDHTEVVITFTQHGQLRVVDPDGTGELFVVPTEEIDEALPELAGLGIDPVEEAMSWTVFAKRLLERSGKLKTILTDPTFVVGIGNIYADEILFEAGLKYDRTTETLSSQEIRRLHRALVGIVHDAIKYRGTSLPDRPFFDVFGEEGEYTDHLEVYSRAGDLSARSRMPIQRVKFGGAWTYYCDTQV